MSDDPTKHNPAYSLLPPDPALRVKAIETEALKKSNAETLLLREEQEKASIIVTDIQRQEIGFLVRSVQQIIETDWKSVMPPPKALGTNAFITGLLDVDGDIIQLLDVELLLAKVYPESLDAQDVVLSDLQSETLKSLNILLVDDSQVARKQLSDVLDSKGISYHVTTNGDEALQVMLIEH